MSVAVAIRNSDRHYNPETARFLSEDPIGFRAGDTNLYRYVSNNPVLSKDPSGKAVTIAALGGACLIGGAIAAIASYSQSSNSCSESDRFSDALLAGGAGCAGGIFLVVGASTGLLGTIAGFAIDAGVTSVGIHGSTSSSNGGGANGDSGKGSSGGSGGGSNGASGGGGSMCPKGQCNGI